MRHDGLDAARDLLRNTFGHADFRGLQAGVIGEILVGRSALAVLDRPVAWRSDPRGARQDAAAGL